VIHLAALKQVGESVEKPEEYFSKNLGGQANLLIAMRNTGVKKLVFSSSAASYGIPDVDLVAENQTPSPINPYGQTKLIGEWMALNAQTAWGLSHVSLRYFNVAGAGWPDLADTQKLNLIPIVFAALKAGVKPKVFGTDYPTPDGSCVRDYVHVMDLAQAHVAALDYLDSGSTPYSVFNVGTGIGSSVLEVMKQIQETTGIEFDFEVEEEFPFTRSLFDDLVLLFKETDITIDDMQHKEWKERYTFKRNNETAVVDFEYKKNGFFGRVVPIQNMSNSQSLLSNIQTQLQTFKQEEYAS
jgi:UDP-glucose 4-epimerase